MDYKSITVLIVGALVGVVILAGFLPVFVSTQNNAGDSVTYENESVRGYSLISTDDELTVDITASAITIGDDTWTNNNQSAWYVVTDDFLIWYGGTAQHMILVHSDVTGDEQNQRWIESGTLTMANGEYTLTATPPNDAPTETYTGTYSWLFVPSESGEYVTVDGSSTRYVNSLNDYIFSGYYYTGSNDTYYSYYNGVAKAGEYSASVTGTLTLVDGTSDVYNCSSPKMHVGEEEFTPYLCLVKANVTGHATSGALYSIFGILPLIAGVGLLLIVVGEVFRRYV